METSPGRIAVVADCYANLPALVTELDAIDRLGCGPNVHTGDLSSLRSAWTSSWAGAASSSVAVPDRSWANHAER